MNPQITGRRIEITESIRGYIVNKFGKLERHFSKISSAHFILDTEPNIFKIEVNIHLPGHEVFVENKNSDMYAAIDILMDKLDTKLAKIKERMNNHHHPFQQDKIASLHQKLHENDE